MMAMRLLVVDLLAERKAFGKEGVKEIISHFDEPEVFLWSPHTNSRIDYGYGTVVEQPVDCDYIVITGSRRNVSSWEPWMDEVSKLILEAEVPIIGICFGHQIIAATFGGRQLQITNLTGHPVISVPTGFDDKGRPTSMTFIGNLYQEGTILQMAKAYQSITDFDEKHPPLFYEKALSQQ